MLKEDFDSWRDCPTGKWFFDSALKEHIEHYRSVLADGGCESENPNAVAMKYMNVTGVVAGLELARNLDPFKEERDEAESNRQAPADQN